SRAVDAAVIEASGMAPPETSGSVTTTRSSSTRIEERVLRRDSRLDQRRNQRQSARYPSDATASSEASIAKSTLRLLGLRGSPVNVARVCERMVSRRSPLRLLVASPYAALTSPTECH